MKKAQEAKKAYVAPKLTTHGDVRELTQVRPVDGSGPVLSPGT